MKVLIVGGYGAIGSHIAERFIQENHTVTVIDKLSNSENISLPHHNIVIDMASAKCEDLFNSERYDVVINAITYKATNDSDKQRYDNYIEGLKNIVSLSLKNNVNQFVQLSSYKIYELGSKSISEEDNLAETQKNVYLEIEQLCKDENSVMNVLIFRLSNFYGPRITENSENIMSISGWKYSELLKGIYKGDKEDFQDHIYISDAIEAIYLGVLKKLNGIYNLSSNEALLNDEAVLMCNQFFKKNGYVYEDICFIKLSYDSFTLNNEKLKSVINWAPRIKVEYGITSMMSWMHHYKKKNNTEIVDYKKELRKKVTKTLVRFLEVTMIFILFMGLEFLLIEFFEIHMEIMVLFVILISVNYNIEEGLYAVLLAWLSNIILLNVYDNSQLRYLLDIDTIALKTVVYLLIGPMLNILINKKKHENQKLKIEIEEIATELKRVEEAYLSAIDVKNALQEEIEHYDDSYSKVLKIANSLNELEHESIYNESVKIIAEIMNAKSVSIYYFENKMKYLRHAASINNNIKFKSSLIIKDHNYLIEAIKDKDVYINRDFLENTPMICAPILKGKDIISMVFIDEIEFKYLTLYYITKLKVVTKLMSNAIMNASNYQMALEKEKYFNDSIIMRKDWFLKRVELFNKYETEKTSQRYYIDLDLNIEQALEKKEFLQSLIRENDYVGVNDFNRIGVILSGAEQEDKHVIINRFTNNGFIVIGGQ